LVTEVESRARNSVLMVGLNVDYFKGVSEFDERSELGLFNKRFDFRGRGDIGLRDGRDLVLVLVFDVSGY
jgi:hypothetical protein